MSFLAKSECRFLFCYVLICGVLLYIEQSRLLNDPCYCKVCRGIDTGKTRNIEREEDKAFDGTSLSKEAQLSCFDFL